jgi:hypothetical protein
VAAKTGSANATESTFVTVSGVLGPVGLRPLALADAAALGGGLCRLPAHQSRVRALVGLGVVLILAGHRLHPGRLDVGVDPFVLRRWDNDIAGQRTGETAQAGSRHSGNS